MPDVPLTAGGGWLVKKVWIDMRKSALCLTILAISVLAGCYQPPDVIVPDNSAQILEQVEGLLAEQNEKHRQDIEAVLRASGGDGWMILLFAIVSLVALGVAVYAIGSRQNVVVQLPPEQRYLPPEMRRRSQVGGYIVVDKKEDDKKLLEIVEDGEKR